MANGLGLLSQGDPMLDLGLGLLAAGGPVVGQPAPSFGQALAQASQFANSREGQRLENDIQREKLRQIQQRKQAVGELQGLLGGTSQVPTTVGTIPAARREGAQPRTVQGLDVELPTLSTQEGQNQLVGLLGQIAPEEVASGLVSNMFGQDERSEPSQVRIARVLADPGESQEVKDNIRAQLADTGNEALMRQIEAQRSLIELQQAQNELQNQNLTQRQREQAVADNFVNTLERAESLLDANNTLEGTTLEPGRVDPGSFREFLFKTTAEIKERFGEDTAEADRLITARNTFQKNASGFAIDLIANLENATNQKFTALRNSIANLGVDPATNRAIISDVVRRAMQETQRAGINIPQGAIRKAEEIIERSQELESAPTVPRRRRAGTTRLRFNPETGELE